MKYKDLMRAGISFTGEAFFRSVLMTIYKRKLGELIRKTRIEVDYDQGRIMMGTIDETGILDYGQVFISFTKHDGINYKGTKILEAEVVVAKNPCFHPGDLRKFQAVDVPGLHHLVDCIVFPQRGSRPHPDEMSGSDLDGDMYFVCWDKTMHPPGENKDAMDFPNAIKTKLRRNVQVSDVTGFISEYIRNDQLGVIANAHVVHADMKNIFCKECITLSKKHSDAVDFPKTGAVPEMTADLRSEKYPDFMMKSDKPRYTSTKILGKLYRQSRSLEQAHNRTYNIELLKDAFVVDRDMMYPGYKNYLDSAHLSYDLYNEKVLQLMSLYGIETEAEVVTGVIQELKKTRGYLQNEIYEIEKIIQGKMSIIRQKVRADFFEEFSEEGESNTVSADDTKKILAKASAWYVVAYDVKFQLVNTGKRLLSFPWIMSEFLSQIKANASPATSEETMDLSAKPERPELVQIGSSIVRHFDTRHEDRLATFKFLCEHFNMISDHFHRWLGPGIRVSFTGLPSLCLMDVYTRDIDVCVELQPQIPEKDFNNLLRNVMAGYWPLTPRSFRIQIDVDSVTVTFSQNTSDIDRTKFIRRQLQKSQTYTLILTFLLDWARKYTIIGRSRSALFSEVVFTLLVLKLLSDVDGNSTETKTTHDDMNHMNVSSWLPGKITPNKQLHTASLVMAVLRNFNSLLISDKKGEIRINVPDPTEDVRSQRFLVPGNLGWRKFKHLTEEILFVYQEIAKNRSVNIFFEQNIIEEDHLMMKLPLEIWGSVMYTETYTARRLSEETGAEISIRRKTFRDTPGLILEAWGTREELWNVPQSLQDLNDKSSKFVTTSARDKAFIGGAFERIFYGSTGPNQQLTFDRYTGRCQPAHKQLTLYVPFVDSSCQNDKNTALEKFKEVFRRQMDLIRQDFERTYHGDLRIALTFGIFYIFYVENPQFTISEFEMALEGHFNPQEKQLEMNLPGRGGWQIANRKRHGRLTKPKPKHIRSSFMPKECDKNNVSAFLGNSNFKERHGEVKYHATFKLGNQDYGKPLEGLVILDKDLLFIEFWLSDLKWMAVDVCRGYNGIPNTKKRLDVRCKLQSGRLMDMEGVKEMADTKMLLEPSTRVLLKPQSHVLYVSPEFRDRVSFVREKHVKSYHYEGPVTEYSIWQDMSIEITTVFEYSIPDSSGRFQDMVEKQEVTVIPKLHPLDTTETDWNSYAENIWELIEQLGEQFDSD
ncbi:RNA-dependent RNA polymerase 1 [Mizuhopecten yessoensis]|uniref:RNA-dependent RNA polymerase n=1 Tax=Mizuhopecten yessoensis TaxID=6573 RepID=A0A210QDP4_MIZYE|nr:RNA-dependent RNA polymerase 1 [Mizuhopecten yessoensis]